MKELKLKHKRDSLGIIFSKIIVCCFVLLCCCQKSIAQQPEQNFVNRSIEWAYRIIEGDSVNPRKSLVVPIPILSYKPETRWIFGVSINTIFRTSHDSITRPSDFKVNISYSQERQFAFIPLVDYFSKGNKWNIRAKYTYTDFGENFYGMGRDASAYNKELYTFGMHRLNAKVAHQFYPQLYGGIQYNYEKMYRVNSVEGGTLETTAPLGWDGYQAAGVGFTLYYDNRDHVFFPHNGQIVELSNVFYEKAFGSHNKFVNLTLDARKFVHLWKENVLALQGFVNMNTGDVPFRMQGVLGSEMFMRGYYNGRYRDKHAMAFQAELRKTIWGPIGMVFFAGGGTVTNHKWGLLDNMLPNYGLGLRLKIIRKERVNIRIDYGFGSKGNDALYISMHESF